MKKIILLLSAVIFILSSNMAFAIDSAPVASWSGKGWFSDFGGNSLGASDPYPAMNDVWGSSGPHSLVEIDYPTGNTNKAIHIKKTATELFNIYMWNEAAKSGVSAFADGGTIRFHALFGGLAANEEIQFRLSNGSSQPTMFTVFSDTAELSLKRGNEKLAVLSENTWYDIAVSFYTSGSLKYNIYLNQAKLVDGAAFTGISGSLSSMNLVNAANLATNSDFWLDNFGIYPGLAIDETQPPDPPKPPEPENDEPFNFFDDFSGYDNGSFTPTGTNYNISLNAAAGDSVVIADDTRYGKALKMTKSSAQNSSNLIFKFSSVKDIKDPIIKISYDMKAEAFSQGMPSMGSISGYTQNGNVKNNADIVSFFKWEDTMQVTYLNGNIDITTGLGGANRDWLHIETIINSIDGTYDLKVTKISDPENPFVRHYKLGYTSDPENVLGAVNALTWHLQTNNDTYNKGNSVFWLTNLSVSSITEFKTVSVTPDNSSANLELNPQISFKMSKAVDVLSLANKITVKSADGTALTNGFSAKIDDNDPTVIILDFTKNLEFGTKYEVKISKNIKSAGNDGIGMKNDYNYSFTTKPAPFSLNEFTVKSGANTVSSISEAAGKTADVKVVLANNEITAGQNYILLIVLKNQSNGMKYIYSQNGNIPLSASDTITHGISVPSEATSGWKLEIHVWESSETGKVLVRKKSL